MKYTQIYEEVQLYLNTFWAPYSVIDWIYFISNNGSLDTGRIQNLTFNNLFTI